MNLEDFRIYITLSVLVSHNRIQSAKSYTGRIAKSYIFIHSFIHSYRREIVLSGKKGNSKVMSSWGRRDVNIACGVRFEDIN